MKISYKCDYALKVILFMSERKNDFAHLEELSETQDIPRKFLELILLELKKGGFVESKKGPKGGYYLLKEPKDIKLGDVVRFIEGSVYPISCVDPTLPQSCKERRKCVFAPVWRKIGECINSIIDGINFQDLVIESARKRKEENLNYCI
ncbi:MAG: hypothetical protein A2X47_11070 [Lentisphaerae bacterium GWF2_38_69]|nr:MAG: hypothetical protein A2X47_11070 [Lentisphaerae bacterium GWF2_38_69]